MPRQSFSAPTGDEGNHEDQILQTTARLIAAGEMSWPHNLPASSATRLVQWVREIRRERLLDLIAARIANELCESARQIGQS